MADQVTQPQFEAEPGVAHPRDHLQAEDGIAAQLEEVVADADLLDPQHLLPDRRQAPLDLGARRAMVAIGRAHRIGQRRAVQLAADQARQSRQQDQVGRRHVLRQLLGDALAQSRQQRRLAHIRQCDDVGHELLAGRTLARHDRRFQHAGHLAQAGLDLAQLDAETADLDLVVGAPDVLDVPVLHPADQVAGAVQASAGGVEGVGHEALRGQAGPSQVTARQAEAADVELADDARRHRLQVGVEHMDRTVPDRLADRRIGAVEALAHGRLPDQRRDDALGRAVAVDQRARPQVAADLVVGGLGHGLSAEDVKLHRRRIAAHAGPIGDLAEVGRREGGVGDLVAMQRLAGLLGGPQLVVAQGQARAHAQRRQPALMGPVEGEGHEVQLAGSGAHAVDLRRGQAMHGQRSVRHRHALGQAGRAGGVDHIGEVVRMVREREIGGIGIGRSRRGLRSLRGRRSCRICRRR